MCKAHVDAYDLERLQNALRSIENWVPYSDGQRIEKEIVIEDLRDMLAKHSA